MRYTLFIWFICWGLSSQAQIGNESLSGWRNKTLIIKEALPFSIDSLTVIPSTIEVFDANSGERLDDSNFLFEYDKMTWLRKPLPDTIDIRFQVTALDLGIKVSRLDTQYIKVDPTTPEGYFYDPFDTQAGNKDILNLDGVEYSGSFSRGISFGNNQNLVLNSNFNMQMSGSLGDDIEILAAISDQNIPLQPEGNTQNIQDFDRVFIQLKKGGTKLIAGDYDMRRPPGYFMNYSKKLQGARLENISKVWEGELKSSASFAISGGKFARQNLATTEGNQGPYKLRGNENELFIIILSGTERVFLDGKLLERGELKDYVIDYNRGEISFTANRLITKDSRIIIEFEYTDQNYLRMMYTLGAEYKKGKWSSRFNLYNQQDSKNSGQQELSSSQIQFLTQAGDNVGELSAPGIDTLEEFTTDRITYKQIDTLVNGFVYPNILMYSVNPDSAKYTARFSEVGNNNGNYMVLSSSANGRVYVWVAPDPVTGLPQGSYEPVVSLIAPEKQQLMTLGGRYDFGLGSYVDIEGAMSVKDRNRFSDVDQNDDRGGAVKLSAQKSFFFHKKDIDETKEQQGLNSDWKLITKADYEFKQIYFEPLSPYRAAEFIRDWNITNTERQNEHLGKIGVELNRNKWGRLSYDIGTFLKDSIYTGFKHSFLSSLNRNGFRVKFSGSLLSTETQEEKTQFFRPDFNVSKTFKDWNGLKVGVLGQREKNTRTNNVSDDLLNESFFFDIAGAYIEMNASKKFNFSTKYQKRWDYAPSENEFKNSTIADELYLTGKWTPSKISNLKWNMTYRNLRVNDSLLTNQEALESYLGRIEHNLFLLKGAIKSTSLYEIGSGQEPELEFSYQKVNDGEGVYTWIDRNLDSIPQLDEFEEAVFQDQANYVRVATFTNNYIRSNLVQFSNSVSIRPKAIWFSEEKNMKSVLSRFSLQSSVKINRKVRQDEGISQWNPFELNLPDSSLVSLNSIYRTTLFFNPKNNEYDIRAGLNYSRNRNVLTTGFESRRNQERFLGFRWNLNKKWTLSSLMSEGRRIADSEFFNNKDYHIRYYEIVPKISFQYNQNFRWGAAYEYNNGTNEIGGGEKMKYHDINTDMTYNNGARTFVRAKFSFILVDYIGEANTPVGFALLQGLQQGKNYRWNINFDRRLSKSLILSLNYEGRKSGDNKIIHVGGASIKATF